MLLRKSIVLLLTMATAAWSQSTSPQTSKTEIAKENNAQAKSQPVQEQPLACQEKDASGKTIRELPASASGCGAPIPHVAESLISTGASRLPDKQVSAKDGTMTQTQGTNAVHALAVAGSENLTLSRSRDYRFAGGNIGCPNCKDMFCATFAPPVPTAVITSTTFLRSRNSGHWYRCQVQHMCGRPEFSDPANPRQDCIGKASCNICRATDDGREAEDDIAFTYQ